MSIVMMVMSAALSAHGFSSERNMRKVSAVEVSRRESMINVASLFGGMAGIVALPSSAFADPKMDISRVSMI